MVVSFEEIKEKLEKGDKELNLWSKRGFFLKTDRVYAFKSHEIKLEMKGQKPLQSYSRQILRSRNLILGWYNNVNTFHFLHFKITYNRIRDGGGRAIGEALKTNTSLTQLYLYVIQQQQRFFILIFPQITDNQISMQIQERIYSVVNFNEIIRGIPFIGHAY